MNDVTYSKVVALTHANCIDGTGAKYAIWKKFGDNARYFSCQYGDPLPDFPRDKETWVIFADYSASRIDLEALGETCGKVTVLDHHKTAREALEGCKGVEVIFDMERSGAVIAWEYFHPDSKVPMLLQYVQDRDLWKFKFEEDSRTIHAGLEALKGKMSSWDNYASNEYKLIGLAEKGEILLERDRNYITGQVPENVKVVEWEGYRCGFLNTGHLVSEIGNAMCLDETLNVDVGVCWFVLKDDTIVLSLRSEKGTGVDVSSIAKKYGGGGHSSSAGCRVDLSMIKLILEGNLLH